MNRPYSSKLIWLASFLVMALLATTPAFTQDAPALKPDVPKLDNPAPPEAKKPSHTLQGKVQHSDVLPRKSQRLRSGTARSYLNRSVLKGQTRDQGYNAEAEAESGIGIIGVKFVMVFGRQPIINRVFPSTPAAKTGVQNNDVIVAVDGIPTLGLAKEEVYDMIVGTPGTPVTLSVQRGDNFLSLTMTRMDLNDITDPFVRRDYLANM